MKEYTHTNAHSDCIHVKEYTQMYVVNEKRLLDVLKYTQLRINRCTRVIFLLHVRLVTTRSKVRVILTCNTLLTRVWGAVVHVSGTVCTDVFIMAHS